MPTVVSPIIDTPRPIIQSPMAGVQDWRLAAAVSNAGALGSIPCAMLAPTGIRHAVEMFRSASAGPLNLNFFCHAEQAPSRTQLLNWQTALQPYYEELGIVETGASVAERKPFDQSLAAIVSELGPEVVSFHFGLPDDDLLDRVKASGAYVLSTATTLEEAHWLVQRGADAVIAQGLEAGGHRGMFMREDLHGQTDTLALTRLLTQSIAVPVIAAGGIGNAQDVARFLDAGAASVQVGTSFLLCVEALTSALHRAALQEADRETVITRLFSGRLARGLSNRLIVDCNDATVEVPPFPHAAAALAPLRAAAEALGRDDFSPLWSGANRRGCAALSAASLVRQLYPLSDD